MGIALITEIRCKVPYALLMLQKFFIPTAQLLRPFYLTEKLATLDWKKAKKTIIHIE